MSLSTNTSAISCNSTFCSAFSLSQSKSVERIFNFGLVKISYDTLTLTFEEVTEIIESSPAPVTLIKTIIMKMIK